MKGWAAAFAGVLLVLAAASSARAAAPVRVLVSIGQNVGTPGDALLKYAERDAERVAGVFTSLGNVDPSRAYLVTNASAERVRETMAEVRGRSAELRDAVVIVYVSAHADASGLRLGSTRLSHAELRELVQKVPARVRVLIVDACSSGSLVRTKGGKAVRPFTIDLEEPRMEGHVVITSSGPNEPAQEWEALGGALFTHHLLSGLRGGADRDADGSVTLFEAYAYAYDRTLVASTGASAGTQHPAHDLDVHGSGDFVMTRPGARASGLAFSAASGGRYIVSSALGGELVAEVDKAPNRPLRLALASGRYVVRKPEGRFVRVGEVLVTPDALTVLDESDMQSVPYAEVARRGAATPRSWAAELGVGIGTPTVPGGEPSPRIGLELRREQGPLDLAAGIAGGHDTFRGQGISVSQNELWFSGDARLRFPVSWLLPYFGLHGGIAWISQRLTPDEDPASSVATPQEQPDRNGTATQLLGTAGLEMPLSSRALVRLEGAAGLTFLGKSDSGDWQAGATFWGRVASGWRW